MWVRRAAIRPVALYARVPTRVLGEVESDLSDDDERAQERLDSAYARFEMTQPVVADRVANALEERTDETAIALGYFLMLAVWLAFDRNFEGRLGEVMSEEFAAAEQSLLLDEELRRLDPAEAVDSDDVIAMEQPELLSFVHGHLESALSVRAGRVDLDDVNAIYRMILIEVLALSYAVRPPAYYRFPSSEYSA